MPWRVRAAFREHPHLQGIYEIRGAEMSPIHSVTLAEAAAAADTADATLVISTSVNDVAGAADQVAARAICNARVVESVAAIAGEAGCPTAPVHRYSEAALNAMVDALIAEIVGGEPTWEAARAWARAHGLPREAVWKKVTERLGPRNKGRRYKASSH
jgi:hypothetical protein